MIDQHAYYFPMPVQPPGKFKKEYTQFIILAKLLFHFFPADIDILFYQYSFGFTNCRNNNFISHTFPKLQFSGVNIDIPEISFIKCIQCVSDILR